MAQEGPNCALFVQGIYNMTPLIGYKLSETKVVVREVAKWYHLFKNILPFTPTCDDVTIPKLYIEPDLFKILVTNVLLRSDIFSEGDQCLLMVHMKDLFTSEIEKLDYEGFQYQDLIRAVFRRVFSVSDSMIYTGEDYTDFFIEGVADKSIKPPGIVNFICDSCQ